MEQIIKQPKWKKVEYSRGEIIRAGDTVKRENVSKDEYNHALQVIDNWRVAHAFPLHVIYIHLRRMAAGKEIIVAERLKRLDSIIDKLRREATMSLWYMQDLGGCRFIVNSVDEVYRYREGYDLSRKRHKRLKVYDYIKEPKQSGYRSLHVVYQYYSDHDDSYNNNMRIEIQFRTHLQHLWATAVETVGIFTKQALKAGQGGEQTKRFFVLVSSLFALMEGTPVVPNTSSDIHELVAELKDIDRRENIIGLLRSIKVATHLTAERYKKNKRGYYLLILNYKTFRLSMRFFSSSNIEEANKIYSQIENGKEQTGVDAVLVRVDSFQILRKAYPNYFTDIGEFVEIVQSHLGKY